MERGASYSLRFRIVSDRFDYSHYSLLATVESAKIVVGQFEAGVGCGFRGGGQFVRAQRGPLLDADTVGQEQSEIRGYRVVDSRLPAGNAVKLVGTRVLLLVESHVPQFHRSLPALTFAGDP